MSKESAARLSQLTSLELEAAERLLEACNGNVERAVSMYFDSPTDFQPADRSGNGVASRSTGPVQQVNGHVSWERLQQLEDADLAQSSVRPTSENSNDRRQAGTNSWLAPLRRRHQQVYTARIESQRRFSEYEQRRGKCLFSPPRHLIMAADFCGALELAKRHDRWLVCVVDTNGDDEFSCAEVHRDLWRNEEVVRLFGTKCLLWHSFSESALAQPYLQRYGPIRRFPHVVLICPVTGALQLDVSLLAEDGSSLSSSSSSSSFVAQRRSREDPKHIASDFLTQVKEFLSRHPVPSEYRSKRTSGPRKRPLTPELSEDSSDGQPLTSPTPDDRSSARTSKRRRPSSGYRIDLTDDEALERAISDSLRNSSSPVESVQDLSGGIGRVAISNKRSSSLADVECLATAGNTVSVRLFLPDSRQDTFHVRASATLDEFLRFIENRTGCSLADGQFVLYSRCPNKSWSAQSAQLEASSLSQLGWPPSQVFFLDKGL